MSEELTQELTQQLRERVELAGVEVLESRTTHLAYAPEIAQAMLARRQASAIVSARFKIVEGAVGMVSNALCSDGGHPRSADQAPYHDPVAPSFVPGDVRVRAPATSANLGPGFDALGLALALYDDVSARVTAGGVTVEVTGEGAGELPNDASHLVVHAMFAAFDELGGRPPGLAVSCVNRIPQARGLGSSSAAIVAGIQLARGLVVEGHRLMDIAAALRLAARIEGHPDNVAPCLLGGFTIAWTAEAGAFAVTRRPSDAVQPTVFVPAERGLTAEARAALPATVPHADAARSAGRAALLVHAITDDPSLLLAATEDRLHQHYRAPGMPATFALVTALREAGVAAVVSGAGPSVLALSPVPDDFAPEAPGIGWVRQRLGVDVTGARVEGVHWDTPSGPLLPQVR